MSQDPADQMDWEDGLPDNEWVDYWCEACEEEIRLPAFAENRCPRCNAFPMEEL